MKITNNPSFGLNIKIIGINKLKDFGLTKRGYYDGDLFQKSAKELEKLPQKEDVKIKFKHEHFGDQKNLVMLIDVIKKTKVFLGVPHKEILSQQTTLAYMNKSEKKYTSGSCRYSDNELSSKTKRTVEKFLKKLTPPTLQELEKIK